MLFDGPYDNTDGYVSDLSKALRDVCAGERITTTSIEVDAEREYLSVPAPNIIEWAVKPEFCNSPSLYEYTRSYQVIRDTFQLRCPICNRGQNADCWGKSRAQLRAEFLLTWSFKHNDDTCRKCGLTRTEFETDGLLQRINQMHLVCGQRSGKSVTAALIGTYVEHRLITMALSHPGGLRGYLGLTLNDPFEMTFLASNETQSQDTIWAKYRAFRRDSPWFQRYVPWVKEQESKQVTPPGMERWSYTESNQKIVNEHPEVFLIINSLNSNSSGLRGRTRVFGGLDEIAYMMEGDSRLSADEVYRSVDNSLQTVRSRAKLERRLSWIGLMCSVSSPRSRDDKSMRLLRDAPSIPGMLAYHYPTWEFNPYEPRENFDAAFAKDPVGAERDFAANPPTAAHPLIQDLPRFRSNAVASSLQPSAQFIYTDFQEGGHRYASVSLKDVQLSREYPRFMAFDAGKNFDAFAGACAHPEFLVDKETGSQRIVTVFDWVIRILPPEGTEVYYDGVYSIVKSVHQRQLVARAEFDHWNATYLIQQLRKLGIHSEEHNTSSDDYRRFRADVYNGLVRMLPPATADMQEDSLAWKTDPPFMQPESCAIYELEGLEEDPDTQKVYNPRKGQRRGWNSNDVAEVCVHVHKMVQEFGYAKKESDMSRDASRRRSEADSMQYRGGVGGQVFSPGRVARGATRGGPGRGW